MDPRAVAPLTLCIPYYRQPHMLAEQLRVLATSPAWLKVIVVDDGSPENPALPIVRAAAPALLEHLSLYRIDVDIPWNREGARNLAATVAASDWLIHVDIDHLLQNVEAFAHFTPAPWVFYRFNRWRVGRADGTRLKDAIDPADEFGPIHPHIDSYLVRRADYWKAGGYNEDFAGVLGGGSEFLRRLERVARAELAPAPLALHVVTSTVIRDASDLHCSRDRTAGKLLQRRLNGCKPTRPLRFPWSRLL